MIVTALATSGCLHRRPWCAAGRTGNGGSAAEAQHLTSELVGRFGTERAPLSAIALHADSSSVTAITNGSGPGGDCSKEQMRSELGIYGFPSIDALPWYVPCRFRHGLEQVVAESLHG